MKREEREEEISERRGRDMKANGGEKGRNDRNVMLEGGGVKGEMSARREGWRGIEINR